MLAMAFDVGASFDRQGLVGNVAVDPGGLGKLHATCMHTPTYLALDYHLLGSDIADDLGMLPHSKLPCRDIALNFTVNL